SIVAVALRPSPIRDALARVMTDADAVVEGVGGIGDSPGRHLVLIDDADMIVDGPADAAIRELLALRRPDVHVVAAGRADLLRTAYGHWTSALRRSRTGVALRPHVEVDGELWHTLLPRRGPQTFPPGRGYLVCDSGVELLQLATP